MGGSCCFQLVPPLFVRCLKEIKGGHKDNRHFGVTTPSLEVTVDLLKHHIGYSAQQFQVGKLYKDSAGTPG